MAQSSIPIIGPIIELIAKVLGFVMEGVYMLFDAMGIASIGLAIIIFTIIVRVAMTPLFVKQQKFSRLNMVMSPELREVQKKYQGKRDNASMVAMQAETKAIYQKYGTSPSGSCLQLLIQLPVLWAVYLIIRNIPSYVTKLQDLYLIIYNGLTTKNIDFILSRTVKADKIADLSDTDRMHTAINNMAVLSDNQWEVVGKAFENNGGSHEVFTDTLDQIHSANTFLGMDMSQSAWSLMKAGVIFAVALPIISAVVQFLSMRLSMARTQKLKSVTQQVTANQADPMQSSMKSMNFIMPIFSLWIGFTLPSGVALYWAIGSVVQVIIQILVNRHMDKIGLDAIIKKNQEKAEKKRKKKKNYISAQTVAQNAQFNTKKLSNANAQVKKANEAADSRAGKKFKEGSLAAKANLVNEFNEKGKK